MESLNAASCNAVTDNQHAISFLQELDRALHDHLQWQNALYRALISEGAIADGALEEDSALRCNFGRWFQGLSDEVKLRDRALGDLWDKHVLMHAAARRLLATHLRHEPIPPFAFDTFVDLAQDFKLVLLKHQRRIISEICTLDPLTGAGNRYAMDLRLLEEWERARRSGLSCCLCLLDIDHFKQINDEHGHTVGDTVLRMISRYLKGDGRAYDNLFRYGGEEFLICMPSTSLDRAQAVLERLREGLANLSIPIDSSHRSVGVTASFGLALLLTDAPVELSIERVDHALLCAKNNGRNRVCVWDTSHLAES